MNNLYNRAFNHPVFNDVLDKLLKIFVANSKMNAEIKIESYSMQKAGWVATILADSKEDVHKQRAQFFAALIFLLNKDDVAISKLSYIIFSRTGNLIATKFLSNLFKDNEDERVFLHDFGTVLDYEMGLKLLNNTLNTQRKSFIVTDFQRILWETLNQENNISISAPTSSGKSFILQYFIKNQFESQDNYCVIYIVPSKALLNQVSEQLRKTLDREVIIKTAFINDESNDIKEMYNSKKIMYILTPERCLNLINQPIDWLNPNLIFIDEIQNVEEEEGRGVLMEHVLEHLSLKWANSKIITAGPNISKGEILFNNLFDRRSFNIETTLSPVLQIKSVVIPDTVNNSLTIKVKSYQGNHSQKVNLKVDFNVKRIFQSNYGDILANVIPKLANDEQTIVYTPRTDYVQTWSMSLLNKIPKSIDRDIRELINFLSDEIHPKYYLIKCLQHRTAFHHSKLPELVRKEIEVLFEKGKIIYLYCTSTLIQGVNLPAKNLFVCSAKKQSQPLTPFEFGNLIGRAGRIKDSLYGNIYFIARDEDSESIANGYYDEEYRKEVMLASSKTIKNTDFIEKDLPSAAQDFNKNKSKHTITFLRHKYLADSEELYRYLRAKDISDGNSNFIINSLSEQLDSVSLPYNLLKLNPSVDPVTQQILYNKIKEEGIEGWVITKNANFSLRIKRENIDKYKFNELSFYWQFSLLCSKLDDIFKISAETYFKHNIKNLSIGSIAHFAFRWLQNMSYKEIIDADLKYYEEKKLIDANNEKHINDRIDKIMSIHSRVITFTLVKYFKVLKDILEFSLTDKEKEEYKLTLSLPIMLELGTMEAPMIEMISSGINRSVALKIFKEYKYANTDENILEWIYSYGNGLSLPSIYIKYLLELGFIKYHQNLL